MILNSSTKMGLGTRGRDRFHAFSISFVVRVLPGTQSLIARRRLSLLGSEMRRTEAGQFLRHVKYLSERCSENNRIIAVHPEHFGNCS